MNNKNNEITKNVKNALEEDVGSGDVTTDLVESHTIAEATLISRDNAILCQSLIHISEPTRPN